MTYIYVGGDEDWHCWPMHDGFIGLDGSLVFSGTLKGVGSTKAKARKNYWENRRLYEC
jgi:hypothetical protein